jgi:hypothetical protein
LRGERAGREEVQETRHQHEALPPLEVVHRISAGKECVAKVTQRRSVRNAPELQTIRRTPILRGTARSSKRFMNSMMILSGGS